MSVLLDALIIFFIGISSENTTDIGRIVTQWMATVRLLKDRIFCAHKKGMVNPQQIFALFTIQEHQGITMKELADQLCITSPSATSLINRLVRQQWVSRVADPLNRKLVRLKIAPSGKTMLQVVMKRQTEAMGGVLSLLSPQDRADFARILTHLHDALLKDSQR